MTLRGEPVRRVIEITAAAGLSAVEWGADVHVPPGATRIAESTRQDAAAAGLRVAAYGSYYRAACQPPSAFSDVLRSAVALGAPRIRIWAGDQGSQSTTSEQRRAIVVDTRAAARQAADQGVELAFEYHGGTLTDTATSTLELLDAIDRDNVSTYWQPPVGLSDAMAVADLDRVLDRVAAVHVFSWWPRQQRHPLAFRAGLWQSIFATLHRRGRPIDALLEFVPDDDATQVAGHAQILNELVTGAVRG